MDSKPAIERFIYDCFHERTEALKRRLEIHMAYWQRFYHPDCLYNSRRGVIENSQKEKIVSISPTDSEIYVVTSGETIYCSRYHLKPLGKSWSIHEIDMECAMCRAKAGSSNCVMCDGSGWLNWSQQANLLRLKRAEHHRTMHSRLESKSEPPNRLHYDPAIEQFMNTHFRERSTAIEKEIEIQDKFVRRFFTPDFDSTRWISSVQDSEAEEILSMTLADSDTHVYTTGHGAMGLRLRYSVRPAAETYVIMQVDYECPLCLKQGRRADCFLCGGTIWEHHKKFSNDRGTLPGPDAPNDLRW